MKGRRGFTLVEIMIVVAIIALLATIALPGLLRTRLTANESNAISTLRSIATAAETFRTAQTTPAYPVNLAALTGAAPPYLTGFSGATKAGYTFAVDNTRDTANTYTAIATPTTPGTTGNRRFCIDETGIMWTDTATFVVTSVCSGQGAAVQM